MNSKKLGTFFFSIGGVAAAFVIVVVLNFVFSAVHTRIDLTEDKVYTLSDGTREILKNLDTKITIRFYYTQDDKQMPVFLKNYARRIEDLLYEYRQVAPKYIKIEKLDPQPDTDAEDSANLDGIDGQMVQMGEKIFLGVAVSSLDQKFAIPFLTPQRERLLEYDLSRAITRVASPEKPVVGVMSALPVMGTRATPQMMQQGQFQGQPEWMAITELKNDFEVTEVQLTAEEIPEDVDVLMVIHPRGITPATEFAIDQFVLRGGKLVAFVDPLSIIDRQNNGANSQMGGGPQTSSGLDKLFAAWGVGFDKSKVVADQNFMTQTSGRNGQPENNMTVLSLSQTAVNTNEVATSQISALLMAFAGSFSGTPTEGLTESVLLRSSAASQMVEGFLATMGAEAIANDFKPDNSEKKLGIRLSGKFKTAFPEGKPGATPPAPDAPVDEKKDDHLKVSENENHVVLIADADMLFDQFCVRVQNFFGQRVVQPLNANISLAQNVIEQMAGDENLINARSRAIKNRPFTLIAKMRTEAEERYRSKIKDLEGELQETQRNLNELQRAKEDQNQKFILSPEQKAELAKFRELQVETNRKLKDLRKDLRREI
ncbi:MAG: Gldg family protein, partial [Verrucomicrobiia bacterium]